MHSFSIIKDKIYVYFYIATNAHHLAPSRQPTCPSKGASWLTFRKFLRSFFANLQNIRMPAFVLECSCYW